MAITLDLRIPACPRLDRVDCTPSRSGFGGVAIFFWLHRADTVFLLTEPERDAWRQLKRAVDNGRYRSQVYGAEAEGRAAKGTRWHDYDQQRDNQCVVCCGTVAKFSEAKDDGRAMW